MWPIAVVNYKVTFDKPHGYRALLLYFSFYFHIFMAYVLSSTFTFLEYAHFGGALRSQKYAHRSTLYAHRTQNSIVLLEYTI